MKAVREFRHTQLCILAWCFDDEQTAPVMDLLDRVTETGAIAPSLWLLEIINGLLMAERRRRLDKPGRKHLIRLLRGLPISLDPETARNAWDDTVQFAATYRLTLYDAAYLEWAHRRKLALAALDKELRGAARSLVFHYSGYN